MLVSGSAGMGASQLTFVLVSESAGMGASQLFNDLYFGSASAF